MNVSVAIYDKQLDLNIITLIVNKKNENKNMLHKQNYKTNTKMTKKAQLRCTIS